MLDGLRLLLETAEALLMCTALLRGGLLLPLVLRRGLLLALPVELLSVCQGLAHLLVTGAWVWIEALAPDLVDTVAGLLGKVLPGPADDLVQLVAHRSSPLAQEKNKSVCADRERC
jgi:hypothetical protein